MCVCLIMRKVSKSRLRGCHGKRPRDRMDFFFFFFLGMVDFSEELKFEEKRKGSSRSEGWKSRSRFKLQG